MSGSTFTLLPPAAGRVREDNNEDRNNVGAHGMGYARTTDWDIVIARGDNIAD